MHGIAISTVLITITLTLLSSYQQYMINSVRNKSNWEAKFENVTYEEAIKIAEDKNIKEISIIQKIGKTDQSFGIMNLKFDIRSYDENAIKNTNIELTKGRMPKNENEILLSIAEDVEYQLKEKFNVGEKVKFTIDGKLKEFEIVRKNREFRIRC